MYQPPVENWLRNAGSSSIKPYVKRECCLGAPDLSSDGKKLDVVVGHVVDIFNRLVDINGMVELGRRGEEQER